MIEALIHVMLGDVGRILLSWYYEYQVGINLIVLAYGALTIWAHLNLRRMTRQMEALIIDLAKDAPAPLDTQYLFDRFSTRWKQLSAGRKGLLPSRNDLWFSVVERTELIEQLGLRKEFVHIVLSKSGALETTESLPKPVARAWELYRHQLLTGVRARHLEPEMQLRIRGIRTSPNANRAPEEPVHGKSY